MDDNTDAARARCGNGHFFETEDLGGLAERMETKGRHSRLPILEAGYRTSSRSAAEVRADALEELQQLGPLCVRKVRQRLLFHLPQEARDVGTKLGTRRRQVD